MKHVRYKRFHFAFGDVSVIDLVLHLVNICIFQGLWKFSQTVEVTPLHLQGVPEEYELRVAHPETGCLSKPVFLKFQDYSETSEEEK